MDGMNIVRLTQEEWLNILKVNKETIIDEFNKSLKILLEEYTRLENNRKKDKLSLIAISILYSGIMSDSEIMKIDLYDKREFNDNVECYELLDFNFIRDIINKNIKKPDSYSLDRNDIPEYEYTRIKIEELKVFSNAFKEFLECESNNLMTGDSVKLWYGDYLDEGDYIEVNR